MTGPLTPTGIASPPQVRLRAGPELDLVNNPPHYQSGGIEAIDVIEAFELPYHIGSAVKYLLRAGRKDNRLMDLEKAAWYIDREIEREKETRDHD